MSGPLLRHVLAALAVAAVLLCGCCSADWPAFRNNQRRTAAQGTASPLSNPAKVPALHVVWRFPKVPALGLGPGFRASPVVYKGRVFIGNGNGYFYALDAKTGIQLWQYPLATKPPLKSLFECNPSSFGIASSATIAQIRGIDAVIFNAPDPCDEHNHLGEGKLFALDIRTGKEIWKSQVIARLDGCTQECKKEFHENLGSSSPLVLGDKVYVGVSDHCDNPVQKGRVVAVELATGLIDKGFTFCSVGKQPSCSDEKEPRGGGVWSPPAGWQGGVYITTGNTRRGTDLEPKPNYGLSLLRLDATTGTVAWPFQPVPFDLDADPDWSAAPTIMSASCGPMVVSTQKDGWTHALNATSGKRLWSYPPHDVPFTCGTDHGDTRYMRSGAVWGDVYVTMNGGLNLAQSGVEGGYHRLHAFDVCEPESKNRRLRWLIDVPDTCCPLDCHCTLGTCKNVSCEFCIGNPTITGGIVYIGTNKGHLVAIADPAVAPPDGVRCEHPEVKTEDCVSTGFRLVPQPRVLANVPLRGSMAHTEPALANGKIYVSTDAGYVYMLKP